eukprot:TRINITY_DN55810_c0_g1_i1.p1 TRINITY_DN55810_c0_g1~~TRINITY_DN55810_c0_g1_i1.p1  ORF type:complete len:170 (-),score=2.00 TRINITY_DN55810_c0_g1_i1:62-571(-)
MMTMFVLFAYGTLPFLRVAERFLQRKAISLCCALRNTFVLSANWGAFQVLALFVRFTPNTLAVSSQNEADSPQQSVESEHSLGRGSQTREDGESSSRPPIAVAKEWPPPQTQSPLSSSSAPSAHWHLASSSWQDPKVPHTPPQGSSSPCDFHIVKANASQIESNHKCET